VLRAVTVGFFSPDGDFPENWREWEQSIAEFYLGAREEHAHGRRDSLLQWFALAEPRRLLVPSGVTWWLERTLSGLAEEACDNAVLARGTMLASTRCVLCELARSVSRSGARLNICGDGGAGRSPSVRRNFEIIEISLEE